MTRRESQSTQLRHAKRVMTNKKTFSTGFGDDVEKVAKLLGIDRVAKKIAEASGKDDCGCTGRKETLNRIFPYKNNQQNESE